MPPSAGQPSPSPWSRGCSRRRGPLALSHHCGPCGSLRAEWGTGLREAGSPGNQAASFTPLPASGSACVVLSPALGSTCPLPPVLPSVTPKGGAPPGEPLPLASQAAWDLCVRPGGWTGSQAQGCGWQVGVALPAAGPPRSARPSPLPSPALLCTHVSVWRCTSAPCPPQPCRLPAPGIIREAPQCCRLSLPPPAVSGRGPGPRSLPVPGPEQQPEMRLLSWNKKTFKNLLMRQLLGPRPQGLLPPPSPP